MASAPSPTGTGAAPPTIHVLHVGPSPDNRGGMAAVMRVLLAAPPGDEYQLDSVATWRSKAPLRRALMFVGSLWAIARWSLSPGVRVVHVHTAVRGSIYRKAVAVVLVSALRRPVLLQLHAGPGDIERFATGLGPLRRAAFARALRAASALAAVSGASAAALREAFGALEVRVVPNPAPPVVSRAAWPTHAGELGVRLLYAGGFSNPAKGGDVLIEALPTVLQSVPDAVVAVAGSGDPPARLRSRVGESLESHGWLEGDAMQAALERCDVFVLPSLSEGLPMALLEAMASGCAIVASRVGGVPEVLTDGENALLVTPNDPEQLAEAIVRLSEDAALRRRLGMAAAERAGVLNREDVNGRLDEIYRDLAGGRP